MEIGYGVVSGDAPYSVADHYYVYYNPNTQSDPSNNTGRAICTKYF